MMKNILLPQKQRENRQGEWCKAAMAAAVMVALLATLLAGTSSVQAAVTSAKTPLGVGNAHIKWQKRFGTGYANAVTPPLLIGNSMYIGSGGVVYQLNKNTGKITGKLKAKGVFGYTTIAPAYNGKDKIFIPLSRGRIEGISIKGGKMKTLWTSASFGGQAISPITCKGSNIFTGAYGNGSKQKYVKIDQSTGKVTQLASNDPEAGRSETDGFYWAGAYATDTYVIFGEEADEKGRSLLRCIDYTAAAPRLTDSISVDGPIRSSVVECDGALFFVSKAKKLYKTSFDKNTGTFRELKSVSLTGESTGVPLIHAGRAYVGTSKSKVDVIDIAAMKRLYSIKTSGYSQGEMLLSTGNPGRLCLYAACNTPTGGIDYIEPGAEEAAVFGSLLKPDFEQYCISPLVCDSKGTLYYKNDSGYIMAVEKGYFGGNPKIVKVKAGKKKASLTWKKVSGAEGYAVYRSTGKKEKFRKIATVKKKTIKRVSTVTYVNKKLRSGKTYYYKIKAFRKAGSKIQYTKYSGVKKLKI